MSAGTGVTHSEQNASRDEPVHFLQIWILPGGPGIRPGYEQKTFPDDERRGRLRLRRLARRRATGRSAIHQDVRVYAALLSAGDAVRHALAAPARGLGPGGARRGAR